MPARLPPGWPALILALAGCPDAPTDATSPAPSSPPTAPADSLEPLPGDAALRLSHPTVLPGQRFSADDPLVFELHLPAGTSIPGDGLPPDDGDTGLDMPGGYGRLLDASVLQLEVPVNGGGVTDAADRYPRAVGMFDRPVFCPVGSRCLWPADTDGLWRGWRIRDLPSGPEVTPLQLAGVGRDLEVPDRPLYQVVGVWMDAGDVPLDASDRLRFEYVGNVPRRATTWHGSPLRPRIRYRSASDDTGDLTCATWDVHCWTVLPDSDVQGLEVRPGPPALVRVHAPLDTEAGVPFPLRIVVTDVFGNPSPARGSFQPTLDGAPLGAPVELSPGAWSARAERTIYAEQLGILGVELADGLVASVVQQPTKTHAAGVAHRRLVGDLHVHSGDGSFTSAFSPTATLGDHSGGFTSGTLAYRYLEEVAGADFGALAEHSYRSEGWRPPGLGFAEFLPGGRCGVGLSDPPSPIDWWGQSQRTARDHSHPGFTAFPAFEWQSRHTGVFDQSQLHRVVVYRDHDPADDLPMLPASAENVPPQCLVRYLMLAGQGPEDVLVVPHMAELVPQSIDWELGFANPGAEDLATPEDMRAYMPVAEVYSAPRERLRVPGLRTLEGAEGGDRDPTAEPYSIRYGWQLGSGAGLIGGSDSHTQMPGVNDDRAASGLAYDANDAGGYAVVLADPTVDPRDGVFEALRDRRSYATSGVRAWLDFSVTAGGTALPMGSEVEGDCHLTFDVEVAAGTHIRKVELFRGRLVPGSLFEVIAERLPGGHVSTFSVRESNPRTALHEPDEEWAYYVRALFGAPLLAGSTLEQQLRHEDAAWSSPIFATWSESCQQTLALGVGPILPGQVTLLEARGAPPRGLVTFLRGKRGTGPCPTELGGLCVDLEDAIEVGTDAAGFLGRARTTWVVPASFPTDELWDFQAVSLAGADSLRSGLVQVRSGLAGLSDGFDDELGPSWRLLEADRMAYSVDIGNLWVQPHAGARWEDAEVGPLVYQSIRGGFSMTAVIDALSVSAPGAPLAAADNRGGLMLRGTGSVEDHVALWVGTDGTRRAWASDSTFEAVTRQLVVPRDGTRAQLRLCRVGSEVRAFWREVGALKWERAQAWSHWDFPDPVQAGIAASVGDDADLLVRVDGVTFRDLDDIEDCALDL